MKKAEFKERVRGSTINDVDMHDVRRVVDDIHDPAVLEAAILHDNRHHAIDEYARRLEELRNESS